MKKFLSIILTAILIIGLLPLTACKEQDTQITSYNISATYNQAEKSLSACEQLTYVNDTENEITDLKLNIWGNAYRQDCLYSPVSDAYSAKAYYNGKSYGNMTISEVENCSGWSIGGEDENILIINLLTPIYPQDNVVVTINFTLNLADVNHRTGVTEKCVNLGNFYPILCAYGKDGFIETPYISCGDPFVSACANYEVTLTYPKDMVVASSGKLLSESNAGDNKICKYTLDNARDFAFVLSDKFEVINQNVGDIEVLYYYYDDDSPQTTLGIACDSVEYYSQTFGNYVYPTLSIVQTGFCMGGMEYPALTMISDSLSVDDTLYTVVHENAHQWWYAMVGSDQVNCSWQDEGLAEYSSLVFFENTPTYGITRTGMLGSATKSYRAFYSVYNQIFGETDTTMNRALSKFISDYEYANIAYNKGLLMFEAVRTAMGSDKFISALKNYFNTYKYTIAPQEALIASFVDCADVEGIFDSFIQGKIII